MVMNFSSSWHLEDIGIRHSYIKPKTPRLNGKVERSHGTDQREFYQPIQTMLTCMPNQLNGKLSITITGRMVSWVENALCTLGRKNAIIFSVSRGCVTSNPPRGY
jgi:transposase InsO family protein